MAHPPIHGAEPLPEWHQSAMAGEPGSGVPSSRCPRHERSGFEGPYRI